MTMISSADLDALVSQNAEILDELRGIRAEQRSGLLTVARHTKGTADILDRTTHGGDALRVTDA
jgi:hypothetical protein